MKVFISWSGEHSKAIAKLLNDWLKRNIQAVTPFYSLEIEKGAKWSGEIDDALEGTKFGIVCLTPENLNSNWIHFETGALYKLDGARIWTFLHKVSPSDVPYPLGKFQHTIVEKGEVYSMFESINRNLEKTGGEPLEDSLLRDVFEDTWEKKLKNSLTCIEKEFAEQAESIKVQRSERELLEEVLELLREKRRPPLFDSDKFMANMKSYQYRSWNLVFEDDINSIGSEKIASAIDEFFETEDPGSTFRFKLGGSEHRVGLMTDSRMVDGDTKLADFVENKLKVTIFRPLPIYE